MPLPFITPPSQGGPRNQNSGGGLFSGLSSSSGSNPAVLEKFTNGRPLSGSGLGGKIRGSGLGGAPRGIANYVQSSFTPLPVFVPILQRWVNLPVLSRLHPQGYLPSHQRSQRPLGASYQPHPLGYSPIRSLIALVATLITCILFFFCSVVLIRVLFSKGPIPSNPFQDPSTLVLTKEEIKRVWEWEIASGHYPSWRRIPFGAGVEGPLRNPTLPRDNSVLSTTGSNALLGGGSHHLYAQAPIQNGQSQLPQQQIQAPNLDNRPNQGPLRAPTAFNPSESIIPIGLPRMYLNISWAQPFSPASGLAPPAPYPPRPIPNSALDLDVVMDYCDFSTNQYVRDCLEVLRMGGNLDNQKRVRRGNANRWRHIYVDHPATLSPAASSEPESEPTRDTLKYIMQDPWYKQSLEAKTARTVERHTTRAAAANHMNLPKISKPHPTHPTADPTCDPDYPRVFHIFWTGPFTDKPYLAISSFIFTQNLGLHLPRDGAPETLRLKRQFLSKVCRPQLWVWLNPGPAGIVPTVTREELHQSLLDNPWSAPFLHPRFQEVVKFKMWNTTEQLDGIPELKPIWRTMGLFNSGGVKYAGGYAPEKSGAALRKTASAPSGLAENEDLQEDEELGRFGTMTAGEDAIAYDRSVASELATVSIDHQKAHPAIGTFSNPPARSSAANKTVSRSATSPAQATGEDDLYHRIGSTSSQGYDRLSVVLSDMARFVLCHRFGGIYLDADTIFLRDWEELWGWKGQFAYRWSRLEKYNTAVLKLHRNSALGSFIFKSAIANGLDFHPMTISRYAKDASMDALLLRLPDALFDAAWLNTEYYQRDRPTFPYLKRFEDFFDPPKEDDAAPAAVGFEGFFRGSFSYHFHNFWWIPFDPLRSWPDLGPRFMSGEIKARRTTRVATAAGRPPVEPDSLPTGTPGSQPSNLWEDEEAAWQQIDDVAHDERDLGWGSVLKRTFEACLRGERPNAYGEWINWGD